LDGTDAIASAVSSRQSRDWATVRHENDVGTVMDRLLGLRGGAQFAECGRRAQQHVEIGLEGVARTATDGLDQVAVASATISSSRGSHNVAAVVKPI
jgi:hypothetical protein